jgi:hypothetical protein
MPIASPSRALFGASTAVRTPKKARHKDARMCDPFASRLRKPLKAAGILSVRQINRFRLEYRTFCSYGARVEFLGKLILIHRRHSKAMRICFC